MASQNDLRRQHTHDLELGATDALQKHITRHVVPPKPVSERKLRFEHARPRILREMMGEATGVFFYGESRTPIYSLLLRGGVGW